MELALGIDLGTTYSAVSYVDVNGNVQLIQNPEQEYITPSAVYFTQDADNKPDVLIGRQAKAKAEVDPAHLVEFVKREIGKDRLEVRWDKIDEEYNPFEFFGRIFSPEEISGYILAQLRKNAEKQLKKEITKAVITVPAYFGSKEKESTKEAGRIAGLDVLEIIPEPGAAALAYGAVFQGKAEKIFVFDLGGGTFDVTILEITDEGYGKNIRMLATDGNHHLGGKDWDDRIIGYAIDRFKENLGVDLIYENTEAAEITLGRLRLDAEKAKIALSKRDKTNVPVIYGGKKLEVELTREKFEALTADLVEECGTYCHNVLSDSGLTWGDLNKVLLVGSMSNVPAIRDAVAGWSKKRIDFGLVNPKTCVAVGAAIQAHIILGGRQITSNSNQTGYDKTGQELDHQQINKAEEEARAVTSVIAKAQNIIPSSLGIIAKNRQGEEVVARLIPKNTAYPVERKNQFGVFADALQKIEIKVVEGEANDPARVELLGTLQLPLDGTLKKGDPIDVTFMYDNNGILKVKARDVTHDKEISSVVKRKGALTEKEIEAAREEVNMLFLG